MNLEPRTKNDLKLALQQELARRCQRNPRYSLRSFAKALGISHTVLSLVFAGKRGFSKEAIRKASDLLDLDPRTTGRLLTEKSISSRRIPTSQPPQTEPEFQYSAQQIALDTFALISEWFHYAILSLLELPDARFEAKWIAKKLRMPETPVKLAMERLERLDLVAQGGDGRWRQTGKPIKVENTISTPYTRKFHKQLLEKAVESLENDPIEVRDFSSITFAMDPANVPYARERIRAFRRRLCAELEQRGNPKAVYNLTVQIFPVTETRPVPSHTTGERNENE